MLLQISEFDLLDVDLDLSVLRAHLSFVEEQMTTQAEKSASELAQRLAKLEGTEPANRGEWEHQQAEGSWLNQEHEQWVSDGLPRLIVNPFVVAAWSVYERVTLDVAELCRKKMGAPLALSDIKGQHLGDRSEKFFQHVLRLPVTYTETQKEELDTLAAFRNCIAHSNGRVSGLGKPLRKRLESGDIVGARQSSEWGYLALGVDYARSTFAVVESRVEKASKVYRAIS